MKLLEPSLIQLLIQTRPPVIAKTISCLVIIPTAPNDPPKDKEPVSPIKILAGGALNHRNPNKTQ